MDEYLEADMYLPGVSEYCSPVFLVIRRRDQTTPFDMKTFRRKLRSLKPNNKVILEKIREALYKYFKFRLVADYRKVNDLVETDKIGSYFFLSMVLIVRFEVNARAAMRQKKG